jgi:hypothetical protein
MWYKMSFCLRVSGGTVTQLCGNSDSAVRQASVGIEWTARPQGQLLQLPHYSPHTPADILFCHADYQLTHRLGYPRPAYLSRLATAPLGTSKPIQSLQVLG